MNLALREHADITGCDIILPREPEAMLLGSAMLGAVASGDVVSIPSPHPPQVHWTWVPSTRGEGKS